MPRPSIECLKLGRLQEAKLVHTLFGEGAELLLAFFQLAVTKVLEIFEHELPLWLSLLLLLLLLLGLNFLLSQI